MSAIEETGKGRVGIKARGFGGNPNNGQSHRANASRKKIQHMKNVRTRSELYQSMQGERANAGHGRQWHEALKALSQGTA